MSTPGFPFAEAAPFVAGKPYLGGVLVKLVPQAANANLAVPHALARVPRFLWILDVGRNAGFSTPLPRGTTAWSNSAISLAIPTLTDYVWGLLV